MNFVNWKYYKNLDGKNNGIVSPEGTQSRLLIDPEVATWLESGNTPLPADKAQS